MQVLTLFFCIHFWSYFIIFLTDATCQNYSFIADKYIFMFVKNITLDLKFDFFINKSRRQ